MSQIVPHEVHPNSDAYDWRKPFYVTIDGQKLTTHDHRVRYFKSDVDACAAGIDEVNRLRSSPTNSEGPT